MKESIHLLSIRTLRGKAESAGTEMERSNWRGTVERKADEVDEAEREVETGGAL
jgi:hypothetical protein